MSKLIAFGDSFTWGTDLKDCLVDGSKEGKNYQIYLKYYRDKFRNSGIFNGDIEWEKCYSRLTWVARLAESRNLEYLCYAIQGCSNQTIVRQVLNHYDEIDDGDTVVINWTWINRWDFYNYTKSCWETMRPTTAKNSQLSVIYHKYIQSELWDKYESLKAISFLYNKLKGRNIKLIMTCIDELLFDDNFHTEKYIESIQQELSDQIIWFQGLGFYRWSKHNNYPIDEEGGHPLEEAHEKAFEYINEITK